MEEQPNNPLHGLTLKTIVEELVEHYGFDELGSRINIRCFTHDPSVKSSLKFLRKTQWARDKVEALYVTKQEAMNQQHTIYGKKDGS
jgi:uncharacterized protein (DUF2132 family)